MKRLSKALSYIHYCALFCINSCKQYKLQIALTINKWKTAIYYNYDLMFLFEIIYNNKYITPNAYTF